MAIMPTGKDCACGRPDVHHVTDPERADRCCTCGLICCAQCCQPTEQGCPPYEQFITSAPEAYDGFGTQTEERWELVDLSRAGTPTRVTYRLVRILDQHRDWQIQRYGSGLYQVFDEADYAAYAKGIA